MALPNLTALAPVLAATKPDAPPNVTTSKAAKATSSNAIELIIPTVYAEFNNKLLVQAIAPPLLELPIAMASSNSLADFKSVVMDSPVNIDPIDL